MNVDTVELYAAAVALVLHERHTSTTAPQRRLGIDYNRRAYFLACMEAGGM